MSERGINQARAEAVARIMREADGDSAVDLHEYLGDAQQALINADAVDREQGIHRVKVV